MDRPQSQKQGRYDRRLRSHHEALAPLRSLIVPSETMPPSSTSSDLVSDRAVYIHTPYCTHNCTFCNLNRRCEAPASEYADLIVKELETLARTDLVRNARYGAVYFGGGTPTVLPPQGLARILKALHTHLNLRPDVEITIETSVSDLSDEHIRVFQDGGVTRFSVGVQTFVDRGRQYLGRHGTGRMAAQRLTDLLDVGFRNVGMDLIYNWPGQTEEDLLADLEIICSLDLAGLSFYALILMERAALHGMIDSGQAPPMGDLQTERRFFERSFDELMDAGFEMLELTKLVRPGRDRYDYIRIRYATGETLPLGAGAGGRLGGVLRRNPSDLAQYAGYVESLPKLLPPYLIVNATYRSIYRLLGAIEFGGFRWHDFDLWIRDSAMIDAAGALFDSLQRDDLVRSDDEGLTLTRDGVFYGNNIAHELAQALIQAIPGGDRPRQHPISHPHGSPHR